MLTVLEPTEAEFTLFQEGQRNSEKSQRSQLDLCVVIFRTRSPANPEVGRLVEHSKRQVSDNYQVKCSFQNRIILGTRLCRMPQNARTRFVFTGLFSF